MGRKSVESATTVENFEDREAAILAEIAGLEAELAAVVSAERERLSTAGPIAPNTGAGARDRAAELRSALHEGRIRLEQARAEHHEAEHITAAEAARCARDAAIQARAAVKVAEDAANVAARRANAARNVAQLHRDAAKRHADEAARLVRERMSGLKGL